MLVNAASPADPEIAESHGIRVIRYRVPSFSAFDPRRLHAHQKAATALLRKYLPDVDYIHGHLPLQYRAALELYGNKADGVYSMHSPFPMELAASCMNGVVDGIRRVIGPPIAARVERKCLKESARINSFSQFTRNCIGNIHGSQLAEKTQVVPGWVDLTRFQILRDRDAAKRQLKWPTDVPVFFTLRRLVPRMGLDRLIRAAAALVHAGHEFKIVIGGTGPLRPDLESLVQELEVTRTVEFVGRVPEEALPVAYGACDCFILPTAMLECFGLIAIEALAAGRPVLATPIAAIPEVIRSFEPRWLANAADEKSITDLMGRYLRGELPSHSPQELRDIVEQRFSAERVLPRLEAVLFGKANGTDNANFGAVNS